MSLDPGTVAASIDLPDLVARSTAELIVLAQREGALLPASLEHGELVRAIVERRFAAGASGRVAGVLEVLPDGFGFVRSLRCDLAPQPYDAFVSPVQIRHLNLRTGHRLAGPLRPPRDGERFFSLQHVDQVNDGAERQLAARVPFAAQSPVLPTRRLHLDAGEDVELRAIELLAPWAHGQRALVTLPAAADGSALLARLAAAMRRRDADLRLFVVLVDQRPEALAQARHTLAGDARLTVLGTTFDEPPARHVALADLALAMAQREVEASAQVVLLFGDLVHLARASNLAQAPSGRLLCAGLDAGAVLGGKRLFAAARACEAGGSLTVIATGNVGDGVVDRAVQEQFQHRGNSEVTFTVDVPPDTTTLDVARTFTRSDDLLLPRPLAAAWQRLRRELLQLPAEQRTGELFARLARHADAAALLAAVASE